MEDEIFDIVTDLLKGEISKTEAIDKLLNLFDVSGSCEWCSTAKENPSGLCSECGRFPSPSNYR